MQFREMTQADIDYLKNHSVSRGVFKKQPDEFEWSYTLEHEGKPLVIGGIQKMTPTTAWGWIDLSDKAKKNIYTVYRVVSEWMLKLCKEKGIVRLMGYTDIGFPEATHLMEHLGFHEEYRMPNFISDSPAIMWVRFFKENSKWSQ